MTENAADSGGRQPGLNRVQLIGRVGRAPETRYTPDGRAVTTFSLGVPRQDAPEAIDWFSVVAWGELAEDCSEQLSQHDLAYVEGRLQVRAWEDASGQRHQQTEITASAAQWLSADPTAQ